MWFVGRMVVSIASYYNLKMGRTKKLFRKKRMLSVENHIMKEITGTILEKLIYKGFKKLS